MGGASARGRKATTLRVQRRPSRLGAKPSTRPRAKLASSMAPRLPTLGRASAPSSGRLAATFVPVLLSVPAPVYCRNRNFEVSRP